jgi:hypothetical protein
LPKCTKEFFTKFGVLARSKDVRLRTPLSPDTQALTDGQTREYKLMGRLRTVDLLIKVAHFVRKVNNILNIKMSWS